MLRFTDFLTQQSQVNIPVNQAKTKLFFKDWDNKDFIQDKTEFIVEAAYEVMPIAGIQIDDLPI